MFGYIYKRQNKINGKIYIGQHQYDKEGIDYNYLGSGSIFKKALSKYGNDNFTYELLESCENIDQLNERESYYIRIFDSVSPKGYNLRDGGKGKVLSEEAHIILSNAQRKYYNEHPEKALYESEARKGSGNPMFGRKQSEKQRKAASEANKGKPRSEKQMKAIRKHGFGSRPAWNKGLKNNLRNSAFGSYWITDGKVDKKWYDKKGPLPENFYRGRSNNFQRGRKKSKIKNK